MPKTLATALSPAFRAKTIAVSWPMPVASAMIAMGAPARVWGTNPVSTRASAIEPTMNVCTPISAGLATGTGDAKRSATGSAAGPGVGWSWA